MSGVDFHPVAKDTAKGMVKVVNYILSLDVTAKDKAARLNKVFNSVGSDFYTQMFNANSELFDSEAITTTDYNELLGQVDRLSWKIVRNYNLGRDSGWIVQDFYDSALGRAQEEAFRNAVSLGKHPTLTRTMVGETCKWCQERAGVHVNPTGDLFARHAHCDCLFVVSGYKSRNGLLTNYAKQPKYDDTAVKIYDKKAELLRVSQPGVGSIKYADDWPKGQKIGKDEKETAEWLLKTLGGEIRYVPRSNNPSPDFRWDGDNLELKTFATSTSWNNLSKQMAKAMKQIQRKGGILLDFPDGAPLWERRDELLDKIEGNLARFDIDFAIVRHSDKLEKYYVKKRKPVDPQ